MDWAPDMIEDADLPEDLRRELVAAATAKGLSYGWLCEIYRRGVNVKIGATGRGFPYGKLDAHDEGEIAVAIAADRRHGVVRFEFGKSVSWLALPATHARQLGELLIAKADEVDKGKM